MKSKASRTSLVLFACGLLTAMLFGHLPGKAHWATVVANAAHGPVFATVTIVLLMIGCRSEFGRRGLILGGCLAVVCAIIIGSGIELVQSMIGGDAEFQDVVNDAAGAIAGAGLFVFAGELHNKKSPSLLLRGVSLLATIMATAFMTAPLAIMAAAYWTRDARFPVIFDPDASLSTYFIQAYEGSSAVVQHLPGSAQPGLLVRSGTSFPWGLLFSSAYPDWSDKRFFAVQMLNPTDQPLTLQLRVYDNVHGGGRPWGFYSPVSIAPNSSSINRLSLAELAAAEGIRHVNLRRVAGVVLYGDRDNQAQEFYVLKMWLE